MSSFIVDDQTINNILQFCSYKVLSPDMADHEAKNELGRKLLKMNICATEQRYSKPYLNKKQKENRIKSFKYEPHTGDLMTRDLIQAIKSLQCLKYQCCEGNIPKRKLFKYLEKQELILLQSYISDLPEYDKARWG